MIRNLIVLDRDGRNLLALNFGECHSLAASPPLLSSFISAIYSFSQSTLGEKVSQIRFEHLHFMLMSRNNVIFLIAVDDEDIDKNQVKLSRIADLFLERYEDALTEFEVTSIAPDFTEFEQLMIALKITQKNCGGRPECEGCPNHRVLPLDEIAKVLRDY